MPFLYTILTGQRNAPRAFAQLDVAITPEDGESRVHFRVFADGNILPPTTATTVNGFCSSANLFSGVPDLTNALVETQVELANASVATAVLRQTVSGRRQDPPRGHKRSP